jgi:hypothetical protein
LGDLFTRFADGGGDAGVLSVQEVEGLKGADGV